MTAPIFGEPTSQAQVVFQQNLNVLFQCGHCSKILLDQVAFAMIADGKLTDLMCPRCNRVWSFCRHPVVTEKDPDLEHAIEDADRHTVPSGVRFYP